MLLLAATNMAVDPYNELGHRKYVPLPLVQVARSEKLRLFGEQPGTPELIVLGSSRVMELNPARMGNPGFNMAVNSAQPEDLLAQTIWLSDRRALPKAVVIGIDFDMFNARIRTDARLVSMRFLYDLISDLPEVRRLAESDDQHQIIPTFWRKYLSRRMFLDSRRAIEANIKRERPRSEFESNGLLVRRSDLAKRAKDGWAAAISMEAIEPYFAEKFSGYEEVSPLRVAVLERALRRLAEKGIATTLVLTAYHPILLERIEADPLLRPRLHEVRGLLERLAKQYEATFWDASDIAAIPCNPNEMWDVVHLMPECAERLADRLARSRVHH